MKAHQDNLSVLEPVPTAAGKTHVPFEPIAIPASLEREPPVRIRPYQKGDRDTIRQLCCDTGFLGGPVDALFQDRDLFADLFTRSYLRYEPEQAFVAGADGQVIGYLFGSVGRHFGRLLLWSGLQTTSKMLLRLAWGHYISHPRSRRFIHWLLTAGLREQPKHPPRAAHLHLQIHKRHRGRGIGRRLWGYYEKQLKAIDMPRCYGAFFSFPERRPEAVYARYGFNVFDRRRTTLFEPEIRDPVEVVCVCKEL